MQTGMDATGRDDEVLLANAQAAQLSYRELAEAMPQQVWTAQPNGALDYVNQQVIEYSRLDARELVGAGWLSIVHPDDIASSVARWTYSLQTGDPYEVEFRLRRAHDETYRWHLGRAIPLRDEAGVIVKWLGTNTDIHDRKQVEAELVLAKAAADAASQAKSAFLANMSHELRTPLNAIIGYSEIVLEEAQDSHLDFLLPDLQKIQSAGKHLLELINAVLDLSKIEAGKVDLCLESFSVAEVVEDVISVVKPLALKNHNTLTFSIEPEVGFMCADQTKVRQSLLNLVGNACKFTTRGSITVEVCRIADERISFAVTDTGIGINSDQLTNLFQPFTQADHGTSRKFGGTGLGLAICKRFAELMGGRLTVATEEGNGSTFILSLPLTVTTA